ncbi:hypothetical protein MA16_Dca024995 [Dendrobium catenatum]|uniref:Uncharacterized protein n=1 Tax=Dendrobium catenatum TaxID=906689 RepID=A0A2I0WCT2_9ASPA|nr:hypothetical protein MA16_Dca024995 [Dendrobium catenatum]
MSGGIFGKSACIGEGGHRRSSDPAFPSFMPFEMAENSDPQRTAGRNERYEKGIQKDTILNSHTNPSDTSTKILPMHSRKTAQPRNRRSNHGNQRSRTEPRHQSHGKTPQARKTNSHRENQGALHGKQLPVEAKESWHGKTHFLGIPKWLLESQGTNIEF